MHGQTRSRRRVLGALAALAAASAAFGGSTGAAAAADGAAPEDAGYANRCRHRCYVDAYGRRRCRLVLMIAVQPRLLSRPDSRLCSARLCISGPSCHPA